MESGSESDIQLFPCLACTNERKMKNQKGQINSLSVIMLIWMSLVVGFTEGLQCYECLSLRCESGAVCDAIKSTMVEIFVPKRHFIHFDPSDMCPEDEPPLFPNLWANLSRECERSDSICLVSPVEVHTIVDGKKHGKKLERELTLTTLGYLRGCASRRKLLEFPETINVRIEFAGSGRNRSTNTTKNGDGNKKQEIFYNMTSIGNGAEITKKVYKDGYEISKIYSHVFYIDQGTKNATRCYQDNCNDKVKFKRSTNGIEMLRSGVSSLLATVLISLFG